jgi:hypothetical protein
MSNERVEQYEDVDSITQGIGKTSGTLPLPGEELSIGGLFTSLTTDLSGLVRKEIDLARTETLEKVTSAGRSLMMLAAGGLILYTGLLALLVAILVALSQAMSLGLAALVVAIVMGLIGFMIISIGRSKLVVLTIVPEKTVKSIQESAAWAEEKLK